MYCGSLDRAYGVHYCELWYELIDIWPELIWLTRYSSLGASFEWYTAFSRNTAALLFFMRSFSIECRIVLEIMIGIILYFF